jgi:DNA-binding NarL/FixJ family response regulator
MREGTDRARRPAESPIAGDRGASRKAGQLFLRHRHRVSSPARPARRAIPIRDIGVLRYSRPLAVRTMAASMARAAIQGNARNRATRQSAPANCALRVLIALPHGVLRECLRCYLDCQPDLTVVGMVPDGPAAVRAAQQLKPQVAVLDAALDGMDGIAATRVLRERAPALGVVILCSAPSPMFERHARAAGASAVLAKDSAGEALLDAVREAAARGRLNEARAAGRRVPRPVGRDPGALEPLTESERRIVRLAASGYTNGRIARALGLSPRTVETYRLRLMHKLGLDHFAALVKYAIRHGLADLE